MPDLSKLRGTLSTYRGGEECTLGSHVRLLIALVGADLSVLSVHLSVRYFIPKLLSTYYMPGPVLWNSAGSALTLSSEIIALEAHGITRGSAFLSLTLFLTAEVMGFCSLIS